MVYIYPEREVCWPHIETICSDVCLKWDIQDSWNSDDEGKLVMATRDWIKCKRRSEFSKEDCGNQPLRKPFKHCLIFDCTEHTVTKCGLVQEFNIFVMILYICSLIFEFICSFMVLIYNFSFSTTTEYFSEIIIERPRHLIIRSDLRTDESKRVDAKHHDILPTTIRVRYLQKRTVWYRGLIDYIATKCDLIDAAWFSRSKTVSWYTITPIEDVNTSFEISLELFSQIRRHANLSKQLKKEDILAKLNQSATYVNSIVFPRHTFDTWVNETVNFTALFAHFIKERDAEKYPLFQIVQ
jgi:hypothetical protein